MAHSARVSATRSSACDTYVNVRGSITPRPNPDNMSNLFLHSRHFLSHFGHRILIVSAHVVNIILGVGEDVAENEGESAVNYTGDEDLGMTLMR